VYKNHQEFAGKTITIEDAAGIIDHATHVAGTMIAQGVYPPAKGMAFNAATLHSYYFDNRCGEDERRRITTIALQPLLWRRSRLEF